jgi:hypothetical protein
VVFNGIVNDSIDLLMDSLEFFQYGNFNDFASFTLGWLHWNGFRRRHNHDVDWIFSPRYRIFPFPHVFIIGYTISSYHNQGQSTDDPNNVDLTGLKQFLYTLETKYSNYKPLRQKLSVPKWTVEKQNIGTP